MEAELVAGLVGLGASLFGAGVSWGLMRAQLSRTRNDLNGVRRVFNAHAEDERIERDRVRLAILLLVSEGKREEMIARFWPE